MRFRIALGIIVFSTLIAISAFAEDSSAFDKDAVPRERTPPWLSKKVKGSAFCCGLMDITTDGNVSNLRLTCSDKAFEKISRKAIEQWSFEPATLKGQPVTRVDAEAKTTALQLDKNMNYVPGREGFMSRKYPKEILPPMRPYPGGIEAWRQDHFNAQTCDAPVEN